MFSSNVESAEKKLVLYNEQLKKQAGTDPLTGLWNRRQMMQYITEKHQKDSNMDFTLGMGDIDFLRKLMTTGVMTAGMQCWCGSPGI